jgi:hypothetical protein
MQAGVDAQTITTATTISYPNPTSVYLNGNGAGDENNGANFVEMVILDGAAAVQSELQLLLDVMTAEVLWGLNSFYKIVVLEMFNGNNTDGGWAEIELRDGIGGTDRTYPGMPVMANRQYSAGEGWANSVDNNNSTWWSSGSGTGSPIIHFLIDANVKVQEVALRARNDAYSAYTGKRWQIWRFAGRDGWQPSPIFDLTSEGNTPGQQYVRPVTFSTATALIDKLTKFAVFRRIGPSISKLNKYSIMKRTGPGVSKLSRYVLLKKVS